MVIDTEIKEVTLDGYQIVSGLMFTHMPRKTDPTCTLWPSAIGFSKQAICLLNSCEHIQMRVSATEKRLAIIPVTSKDKDGVRWIKSIKQPTARKIECAKFASQLYEVWGLDPSLNYRAVGKRCSADGKILLIFDFTSPEIWKSKKDEGEKHE